GGGEGCRYRCRRELRVRGRGHPSGQPVRRGPAVPAVHVRRRVRLGLGHRLPPAGPAVRPVRAVRESQPPPARRRGPGDRRVLVGLVRPWGPPDPPGPAGPPPPPPPPA